MCDGRGGKVVSADEGTEDAEMGMEGPGGDFVEPGNIPRGDCGGSVLEGPEVGEGGGWVGGAPGGALILVGAVGRGIVTGGAPICRFIC